MPTSLERLVEHPARPGPTNGRPSMSSWSPGCSPTIITSARSLPSPNTVWVAVCHRSQARHPAPAARSSSSERLAGRSTPSVICPGSGHAGVLPREAPH